MHSGRSNETSVVMYNLPSEWDLAELKNTVLSALGEVTIPMHSEQVGNDMIFNFVDAEQAKEALAKLGAATFGEQPMSVKMFEEPTMDKFSFDKQESVDLLLPYFDSVWRGYVDSGMVLTQKGSAPLTGDQETNEAQTSPECELVNKLHQLGVLTNKLPRGVTLFHQQQKMVESEKEPVMAAVEEELQDKVVENGQDAGAEEVEEIVEIAPLPLLLKKSSNPTKKSKKKKRRRKRKKKKKKKQATSLMDFLKKLETEEQKVEEEVESQPEPAKKVVKKRKKKKKARVFDLDIDGQMTAKDIEARKEFEEKVAVKKITITTTSRKQYEGSKGVKAWHGGAGFGSSYTNDLSHWDVNSWQSSQNQRNTEIRDVLAFISQQISNEECVVEFLRQSCLMPVLIDYCNNDSLTDINSRSKLYMEIFECVGKMALVPALLPLLTEQYSGRNVVGCIGKIAKQVKLVASLKKNDDGDGDDTDALAAVVLSVFFNLKAILSAEEEVEPALPKQMMPEINEDYCAIMRELCFGSVETMESMLGHKYASMTINMQRKLMKSLAREYGDLPNSLPIHEESSVFFRFCEDSMAHAQMLIIPCDGTPYAGGCFIFDICFPDNYPNSPPKVNLQTTGKGSVRFNPNLYNCGKVCLSLLGTWSGNSPGEMWNPGLSSLLQVAISIQSLIFVPEPYYNEPGWERDMGTARGDKMSRDYNKIREVGTTRFAIIDMLENTPVAFKDVINNHFRMQADRILTNVATWMGEDHELTQKTEALLMELRTQAYSTGA